jgi:CheY-like chemotaxis protein
MNFIIIEPFEKLSNLWIAALNNEHTIYPVLINEDTTIIDIIENLNSKKDESNFKNTIILINVAIPLQSSTKLMEDGVELIQRIRCQLQLKNAIVPYSTFTLDSILKKSESNFILTAPGCYYMQFPYFDIEEIIGLKPLEDLSFIKPYILPAIKLGKGRHSLANFAAMLSLAKIELKGQKKDAEKALIDFLIIQDNNKVLKELSNFQDNVIYKMLHFYYFKAYNKGTLPKIKVTKIVNKGIILDDLADKGWQHIIGSILYNNASDLMIAPLVIENNKIEVDKTFDALKNKIIADKPYYLLLDLRLNDEEGVYDLKDLDGYKLLQLIKKDLQLAPLPVIMFTASTNAETTKMLLEAGAETVWTKPGIDEGLNKAELIRRYNKLKSIINDVNSKYDLPTGIEVRFNTLEGNLSLEQQAIGFIEYLNNIAFRCSLVDFTNDASFPDFNNYTDIVCDTNFLLSDNMHINFYETFTNFYKLTCLLKNKKTEHTLTFTENTKGKKSETIKQEFAKIVVVNSVWDELYNKAKLVHKDKGLWKRASLVLIVLRNLFKDKKIRTEINFINEYCDDDLNVKTWKIKTDMVLPNRKHADDFIVDEVERILNNKEFIVSNSNLTSELLKTKDTLEIAISDAIRINSNKKIEAEATLKGYDFCKVKNKYNTAAQHIAEAINSLPGSNNYRKCTIITADTKVLILTNETLHGIDKLPNKIVACTSDITKYTIMNYEDFNAKLNNIIL